jgi:hypothetical protein
MYYEINKNNINVIYLLKIIKLLSKNVNLSNKIFYKHFKSIITNN